MITPTTWKLLSLVSILVISFIATTTGAEEQSFPAERHELSLSSGRSLAYYTFGSNDEGEGEDAILYLNGFPGSGLEAAIGAEHVHSKTLVALDRPGLAYTDPPIPGEDDEDPFATCTGDIWELAKHLKWKTFSVVGVSGGGPHTLALLASYLTSGNDSTKPKLEKVTLVGGVILSAGTEDMMPINQHIFNVVKNYESSWFSRLQLRLMFDVPHFLLPILPKFMVQGMVKGNKDLAKVDMDILQNNETVVEWMSTVIKAAVRQGSAGVVSDARRCFTANHSFEKILRDNYGSADLNKKKILPEVTIYQGKEDTNVPLSHATYMHEEIFYRESKLITYDDLGHLSLVLQEAKTYMGAIDAKSETNLEEEAESETHVQDTANDDVEINNDAQDGEMETEAGDVEPENQSDVEDSQTETETEVGDVEAETQTNSEGEETVAEREAKTDAQDVRTETNVGDQDTETEEKPVQDEL